MRNRNRAISLGPFAARSNSRIQPIEMQIMQQSKIIEKHEGVIARQTELQTKLAAVSIGSSVITALFLSWIAFSQLKITERQVSLEYAKVSPLFSVKASIDGVQNDESLILPSKINIELSRGEAEVHDVRVYQDFLVAVLIGTDNYFCHVRIVNSHNSTSSVLERSISPILKTISSDRAFYYNAARDFVVFSDPATWVVVEYSDLTGQRYKRIFRNSGPRFVSSPLTSLPLHSVFETRKVEIRADARRFPDMFVDARIKPNSEGCERILHNLQR